jgi:predicted AlkP superfamily pyrophosphatase or phosphodiesterase
VGRFQAQSLRPLHETEATSPLRLSRPPLAAAFAPHRRNLFKGLHVRRRFLLLALLLLFANAGRAQAPVTDVKPTVILISLDGFRWDYPQKYSSPTIRQLIARGVSTSLIPSYPSKTFPNHYTIVTGLYPGHHGVVGNTVRDLDTGRRLTMANRVENQDPLWWGGEPLWVSVQRAGGTAAPMFWPGSEAPIMGQRPRFWEPFSEAVPANARVDRILQWLDLPVTERPTFLTLYFSDVDGAGHDSGPDSRAVAEAVRRVDRYLDRLIRGLTMRGLQNRVNLVIVSDHGMAESNASQVVVLDDYLDLNGIDVVDLNPTFGLFPPAGREEAVYKALAAANPRMKVFRKAESPLHWRFRDQPRVPPIVGVVDEGWQVLRKATVASQLASRRLGPVGVHGYDPAEAMSMRGIFIATGPAFRAGATVPPFENVNIYGALADVLGVKAGANDGDPKVARSLLR